MSEHEGFCLPIIEAMHFGMPVIGYDAGALAQTIGTGGIVVKDKKPAHLAHLVAELATETSLRQELVARGKERVKQFHFDAFSQRVKHLVSLIDDSVSTRHAV
jgi:glycosyltransferase involved in cell wall biosynthesis